MTRLAAEHVGPVLAEFGFRRAGARFELPSTTHFAAIGFTSSPSSTSGIAFLDVVAQVISREDWAREASRLGWGKRPDLRALYTFGEQWALSGGMGWIACGGGSVECLATEIVYAVRQAVPAVLAVAPTRRRSGPERWIE